MGEPWVIFKCQIGSRERFFAWCRPSPDRPGFEEIYYTELDGLTAWSPSGGDLPVLGDHVATIPFSPEVASSGERFQPSRDGSGLAPDPGWRPATPTLVTAETDAGGA